jgi:hypothetical protein
MSDPEALPTKPASPDRLSTALDYATSHPEPESPDQVVTRAKAYALFLTGDWQKVGVVQAAVVERGQGYSTAPNVVFDPPGATAEATVVNGEVDSITMKKPGLYDTVPAVTIEGGGGSGATAVATLAVPVS